MLAGDNSPNWANSGGTGMAEVQTLQRRTKMGSLTSKEIILMHGSPEGYILFGGLLLCLGDHIPIFNYSQPIISHLNIGPHKLLE